MVTQQLKERENKEIIQLSETGYCLIQPKTPKTISMIIVVISGGDVDKQNDLWYNRLYFYDIFFTNLNLRHIGCGIVKPSLSVNKMKKHFKCV